MTTSTRQPAGIALLITLLVVALLTIVVIEFTYSTEVEAHLARNASALAQARYLARAGVVLAELALKLDAAQKAATPPILPNAETLTDPWAQPFPPREIGEGVGETAFRIEDESSRFNLNSLAKAAKANPVALEARKTLFQGLLAALGLDINLLFPLLDWLDADDEVTTKNGAESEYYGKLAPPYVPRNGKLLGIDELPLVRGFSELKREEWAALRGVTSVMPDDTLAINVNTASGLLLAALLNAVDAAPTAKAIIARRAERPFVKPTDLEDIPGWLQVPSPVRSIFTTQSNTFTIHALGAAGDVKLGLAVTEKRDHSQLTRIAWREERGSAFLTSTPPSDRMPLFPPANR